MQKKKIDNYTIYLDKKIGEGSFAKVYIGQQDKTHLKVAVKMLDKQSIDKDNYIKQALLSEIQILKILKSDNIVGFLDVMESANYYYLIQQFCEGGDLRGLIKKRGKFPEKQAIEILKEICNGFIQILKQGIIHRDLKPENLLINQGKIKICDFGFAKKIHSKNFKNQTMVGTPLYMSIQILKGQPYTSKCDIWALGFIFYELINGVTPWVANTQYQLIRNIQKKPIKFPVQVSPATKDFLTKCLRVYEKDRFCWDQLLRHQIFNNCFSQYMQKQYRFQNKLKTLMGQLRVKINQQNLDLQKLFSQMGYTKATQLSYQDFEKFLKTIDIHLNSEQKRYIFQKLDVDQSDSISYQQFENQLKKNNIPMKSRIRVEKKTSYALQSQQISQQDKKQYILSKVLNAFLKLSHKMKKNKITLQQVFDAYDVNKDGDMTIKQLSRILKKLDQSFTPQQLQMAFNLVDLDHSNSITFDQFNIYFCKSTGTPVHNYMTQKNNNEIKVFGSSHSVKSDKSWSQQNGSSKSIKNIKGQ